MSQITIGITGSNGFIGSALKFYGSRVMGYNMVDIDRNFKCIDMNLDHIFHLSCIHRRNIPGEVLELNKTIDENFINFLNDLTKKPSLYLLSSVQENDSTEYGESKRNTHKLLTHYSKDNNINYKKYIVKNTFGPFSVPYKFSFIATFCQNIILNKNSDIINKDIELYYIEDLVYNLLQFPDEINIQIYNSNIEYIYNKLVILNKDITKIDCQLDLLLANTLIYFKRII